MPSNAESMDVPTWPVYDLIVHEDGRIVASGPQMPTTGHSTRADALNAVAGTAVRLGRPVRARATEPDGAVWPLIIAPDGSVREAPDGATPAPAQKAQKARKARQVQEAPTTPKKRSFGLRRQAKEKRGAGTAAPGPVAPASATGQPGQPGQPGQGGQLVGSDYAGPLAQVTEHLRVGQYAEAVKLATELDDRAAGVLGVSHPDVLHIREKRAEAAARTGDAFGSIQLYRDVAERWHYRGEGAMAEDVARRAEELWRQMPQGDEALSAGLVVVRMRNQMPGQSGDALTAVLADRVRLLQAHAGASENMQMAPQQPVAAAPSHSHPVAQQPVAAEVPAQQPVVAAPVQYAAPALARPVAAEVAAQPVAAEVAAQPVAAEIPVQPVSAAEVPVRPVVAEAHARPVMAAPVQYAVPVLAQPAGAEIAARLLAAEVPARTAAEHTPEPRSVAGAGAPEQPVAVSYPHPVAAGAAVRPAAEHTPAAHPVTDTSAPAAANNVAHSAGEHAPAQPATPNGTAQPVADTTAPQQPRPAMRHRAWERAASPVRSAG
ncbi:hypothetical protein [Streptomyces daliensis]